MMRVLFSSILVLLSLLVVGGRRAPAAPQPPVHGDLNETSIKLAQIVRLYHDKGIPKQRRNLIIYHMLCRDTDSNSVDVGTNNVALFTSAVKNHHDGSPQDAFYLFNVIGGKENPFRSYIPLSQHNVGVIDWLHANDEHELNHKTVKMLGLALLDNFEAVFFAGSDVRGPLVHRKNGEWIQEFRKLLDSNNVGMVGPVINCEGEPHVSTYMFGWKSKLFTPLFESDAAQEFFGSSKFVITAGYNISSALYARKFRTPYFDGRCALGTGSKLQPVLNPVTWCNLLPREVIFMYWGNEAVRSLGYLCEHTLSLMRDYMATAVHSQPDIGLVVPETLVGGRMYEMYREYSKELYMDRTRPRAATGLVTTLTGVGNDENVLSNTGNYDYDQAVALAAAKKKQHQQSGFSLFGFGGGGGSGKEKTTKDGADAAAALKPSVTPPAQAWDAGSAQEVCLAVRTAFMHDSTEEIRSKTIFEDVDIDGFIMSLLRQTNPAWVAYFFVTDTNPFELRLQEILGKYQDPRLVYTPIPPSHRVPFTSVGAGYEATDYVMGRLIKRKQCRWLSATNADNVYGSHVVDRVLTARSDSITGKMPDMLLNPIDSRNFMWADYLERRDLTRGLGVEQAWTDYCTGLEASLLFNSYTYTVQPRPVLGKVDLAAVFYSRSKYEAANVTFSDFTDHKRFPCTGCQDGYLTEHLARNLRWDYARLSVDGLRSIIFHGPSPTLCIAAGNVWFDYPAVNKVGCISQHTVRVLSYHNPKYYDWIHLNFKANKVCLRLSRTGFFSEVGQ